MLRNLFDGLKVVKSDISKSHIGLNFGKVDYAKTSFNVDAFYNLNKDLEKVEAISTDLILKIKIGTS